jgi:hypothetical protein
MITKKVKKKILELNAVERISKGEIQKAEKALGTKFHADYIWVIQNFGFLDDFETVVSGLGAYEQFENVVYLNNNILKEHIDSLPEQMIAISYENPLSKVLVLDNKTGEIYAYSYKCESSELKFPSFNDFLESVYFPDSPKD